GVRRRLRLGIRGRQLELPARPEPLGRDRKGRLLVVGVEEDQERAVDNRLTMRGARAERLPVQEDPEARTVRAVPVALGHLAAAAADPRGVGGAGGGTVTDEERRAAEDRLLLPRADQPAREPLRPPLALVQVPVDPGELVVLAVRVVVAVLRAGDLVTGDQH